MKRYIIILNPIAGKGHAEKHRQEIETFFKKHQLEYDIIVTERPGHAIGIAEKYGVQPNTIVVAAGGDGTSNEVINGLMKASAKMKGETPCFGVLAIGRGNDFAFSANIPSGLDKCLLLLKDGAPHAMDVGEVKGGDYPDGRYFGNGIGVGFDTLVGLEAARMEHIHGGFAYTLGAIKTLIKYPAAPIVEIQFDTKILTVSPAMVSVMNGRRMGGSFYMAPYAEMDDGQFDYCIAHQGKRLQLLSAMMAYTKGTQAGRDDTLTGKSNHIDIKAISGTLAVHADGETICKEGTRLEVINHKHALNIIK